MFAVVKHKTQPAIFYRTSAEILHAAYMCCYVAPGLIDGLMRQQNGLT